MGLPKENLRVLWGSSEGMPDDEEDSGDPRWEREGRYGELQWRPVHPHQPTTYISQLLSTLMTGLRIGILCINNSSGNTIPG